MSNKITITETFNDRHTGRAAVNPSPRRKRTKKAVPQS